MNKYPRWKFGLLLVVLILGIVYAFPNLFGENPAVQISPHTGYTVDKAVNQKIVDILTSNKIPYTSISGDNNLLLIRFSNADNQIKANDLIKTAMGDNYTVALNLASATPSFLTDIGANPMKLGLDLQGGVHFLLAIDVDTLIKKRVAGYMRGIGDELRAQHIRYTGLNRTTNNQIVMQFSSSDTMNQASQLITKQYTDLTVQTTDTNGIYQLTALMSPAAIINAQNNAIEQTTSILRNRINALGISEPIVQRQGAERIAVDLPGVQDTARAQEILGGTATLEFHLVDDQHDLAQALSGNVPAGSKIYYSQDGQPVLLKDQVVLTGTSITNATSSYSEDGKPSVNIWLGGGGESNFYKLTGQNIGHGMASVYIETTMTPVLKDGKTVYVPHTTEKVINVATIQSALPNNFQITGLTDANQARDLALLLRAGALPTTITIIEETTVGPSLGKQNINMGIFSVEIGLAVIVLFMIAYYRVFGLVADIALFMNLVLLVAVLSIIGATLTLPGLAGIVLTMGMAVDANVLIFERIREEMRNGMSPHACIEAGYQKALATIVDANVTTLIAALALFGIGTGAVRGFAVTLTLGILISMFTAIMGTRAMVYLIYGRKHHIKKLSIGI
ncbi:MAG: protein translocase subunit SecD [Legionellales bacterium]|nr:protein translocase subunit SecD [Legionellales bacterium]